MKSHTSVMVIVVGLVLVALGQLMQEIMPLIGRAAFQSAGTGSYSASSYALDLTSYYIVAGIVIVLGVVTLIMDLRIR